MILRQGFCRSQAVSPLGLLGTDLRNRGRNVQDQAPSGTKAIAGAAILVTSFRKWYDKPDLGRWSGTEVLPLKCSADATTSLGRNRV